MKKLKTIEVVAAYNLLKTAKINKVSTDADKFAIIKTTRALKKIAEDFESFKTDSIEALKGENHDEMVKLAQKWQKEEADKVEVTLTAEEMQKVNAYFSKYNSDITDCIKEDSKKVHEIEAKEISEESFMQLVGSNDWNIEQIMSIENVLR